MHELGESSEEMHREVGRQAAHAGVDLLVTVGPGAAFTAKGALAEGLGGDHVVHTATLEVALTTIPGLLKDGDVVLVKGSRAVGLEKLVKQLVESIGASDIEKTEEIAAGAGRRGDDH